MRTSVCTRVVALPRPSEDTTHVCYNTMIGTVLGAPPEVAELLEAGLERDLSDDDVAAVGEETVEYLLDRGWLVADDDDEARRMGRLTAGVRAALAQLGEYAVVPWPQTDAPVDPRIALDAVTALAEVEGRGTRRYHLYAFDPEQRRMLDDLAEPMREHWRQTPTAEDEDRVLVITCDPHASPDWERWDFVGDGEGRLRVPLDPARMDGGDLRSWVAEVAQLAADAAQVGFPSWIVLYDSADNPPGWLDEALEHLIGTGMLYQSARPYSFVAKQSIDDWREYLCELDNIDFELLDVAMAEAAVKRSRSLLHMHGGGIVHRADQLISARQPLTPTVYHCQPVAAGYYANLAGEIWPCPKMAAGLGREAGAPPLATFDADGITPDEEAAQMWRGRDVLAIEKCAGCAGMFACAGGCALEAATEHGGDPVTPSRQPIERFMERLIHSQQRRLTGQFGPRGLDDLRGAGS
jgi:radical SAM protein with 4Fe4S-binding SPASM domain